jgi:pantetheine-phosphate adenylyltransferase
VKYRTVATGGTFDHLHRGHEALLAASFAAGGGGEVVIGVTSDAFARREGKSPDQTYDERVRSLERFLGARFPGRKHTIARLDDYFGPGIASPDVEAIVVTKETAPRVPLANALRAKKGYLPLEVVVVEHVLAADGAPISSTRIRRGEIDPEGNLLAPGPRGRLNELR